MAPANGPSNTVGQQKDLKGQRPAGGWFTAGVITLVAALIGALVPVVASIGAVYYPAIRQCNQDASEMETQLTSILLELSARERRINSILSTVKNDTWRTYSNRGWC